MFPQFAVFPRAEGYFCFFRSRTPQALTPAFIIANTGSFLIQLEVSALGWFFCPLATHGEESPAGFTHSLILLWRRLSIIFSGSLPLKPQQPPQHNVVLNFPFPILWFYSHICQIRYLICRIVYYFLGNIQLFGSLRLTREGFCSSVANTVGLILKCAR